MKAIYTFTDQILLDQAAAGDTAAYEVLYKRYAAKLYRFIYFRIREQELVNDIVHDIFLKFWESIKSNPKIKNVRAYLYMMARNAVIDRYRTHKDEVGLAEADKVEDMVDIHDTVILQDELKELLANIKKLPNEYQEVLHLRYVEDLTITEIAQVLAKSKGAVKVSIHRAVKQLKIIYRDNS